MKFSKLKIKKNLILGLLLTCVYLIFNIIFFCVLFSAALLPCIYMSVMAVVLLAFGGGIFWLVMNYRKLTRFIIGCILILCIIAAEVFGIWFINKGVDTVNTTIQNSEIENAEVGIYVLRNDPATKIEDAKDYTFGTLKDLDSEITEKALGEIAKTINKTPKYKNFSDIGAVLQALIDNTEIKAIIVNKSFLEILSEIDDYKESLDKIREIHTVIIKNNVLSSEASPYLKDYFTMYISGIDCGGSITRRSRSDVNILACVNVRTGQILLISTPRDYYIPLSISKGIPDKLTHAGIYGIEVSRETVGMLYDVDIDYHFRVNFDGFKDIIDALGGIEVYSQQDFVSDGKYHYKKGMNTVNGEEALMFSRERYHLIEGDRQRGKNQMEVIKGVIKKAASSALLKNYTKVMEGIAGSFELNMPYDVFSGLVRNQIDDNPKWNVVSYAVNGTGASRRPYSLSTNAYVMLPDYDTVAHAKELIKQIKEGEIPKP